MNFSNRIWLWHKPSVHRGTRQGLWMDYLGFPLLFMPERDKTSLPYHGIILELWPDLWISLGLASDQIVAAFIRIPSLDKRWSHNQIRSKTPQTEFSLWKGQRIKSPYCVCWIAAAVSCSIIFFWHFAIIWKDLERCLSFGSHLWWFFTAL